MSVIVAYVYGGCLQVVAWSALINGRLRSFSDILLTALSIAIVYFVVLRRDTEQGELTVGDMPLSRYIISIAIGFLMFRITPVNEDAGALWGVRLAALVIATLCTFFIASSKDGWGFVVGRGAVITTAALSVISFFSVYYFALNKEHDDLARWSAGLFWMVMSISSLMVARSLPNHLLLPWLSRFVVSVVAVCIFMIAVGGGNVGSMVYYYCGVLDSFEEREYSEFYERADDLVKAGDTIGLGRRALESVIEDLAIKPQFKERAEALSVLETVSLQNRLWAATLGLYDSRGNSNNSNVHAHSGYNLALFEMGHSVQAVENLNAMTGGRSPVGIERVPLVLLQFWSGNYSAVQANSREVYQSVFEPLLFPTKESKAYKTVGELIPTHIIKGMSSRLTLYALVKIVEGAGGKAFHPGEEIGATGVAAPVDIAALSGGGDTWNEEEIWIEGRGVSPKKRGYNLVVIERSSGEIIDVASFDTWDNSPEGLRLAGYLKRIEYGQIVVGTVRDEGAGGLVEVAKDEMRKLGVEQFPPYWGSHCFIGVKGSGERLIVEGIGVQNNPISVGVLKSNIGGAPIGDRDALLQFLANEARSARAGFAVYLSGLKSEDIVAVARL